MPDPWLKLLKLRFFLGPSDATSKMGQKMRANFTSPKRERGKNVFPRSRFGLVKNLHSLRRIVLLLHDKRLE
jgi:hypothetical protein